MKYLHSWWKENHTTPNHPLPSLTRGCTLMYQPVSWSIYSRDITEVTTDLFAGPCKWPLTWLSYDHNKWQNNLTSRLMHAVPMWTCTQPVTGAKALCWCPSTSRNPISRDTSHHARQRQFVKLQHDQFPTYWYRHVDIGLWRFALPCQEGIKRGWNKDLKEKKRNMEKRKSTELRNPWIHKEGIPLGGYLTKRDFVCS